MQHAIFSLFLILLCAFPVNDLFAKNNITDTSPTEKTVKGKITDSENSSPLPGVNVIVKGTSQGTSSNCEGDYEITVADMLLSIVHISILLLLIMAVDG